MYVVCDCLVSALIMADNSPQDYPTNTGMTGIRPLTWTFIAKCAIGASYACNVCIHVCSTVCKYKYHYMWYITCLYRFGRVFVCIPVCMDYIYDVCVCVCVLVYVTLYWQVSLYKVMHMVIVQIAFSLVL